MPLETPAVIPGFRADGANAESIESAAAIPILLIDDDPDCRMLISDAITRSGVNHSVYEVANGNEALDFLYRRGPWKAAPRPGLIYLDVEMPGMTGLETLEQMRLNTAFDDIPVVMMTGVSEEECIRRAARGGANSYTIKPCDVEQFVQTVLDATEYWLKIHQCPRRHLAADRCRR